MSTPPPSDPPRKPHNPWKWISAALAVAAIGLVVWGVSAQSEVDDLQAQAEQTEESSSAVASSAKDAYADISEQLGSTNADLADTEDDLAQAEKDAASADEDAAAAKKAAEQAEDSTAKAEAEAEQAKAEAQAAESRTAIAADCAKAYVSAFGLLFEGESVETQAALVKEQLQSISASCESALAGA